MSISGELVLELLAMLTGLVVLIRELRKTRQTNSAENAETRYMMNGMKDQLVKEVGQAAFAAGVKAQKEIAERELAAKRGDEGA